MSNIGAAIQQGVGTLGQLLAARIQVPPNMMPQMYTPMSLETPPQHRFQQAFSSSGPYCRRE